MKIVSKAYGPRRVVEAIRAMEMKMVFGHALGVKDHKEAAK